MQGTAESPNAIREEWCDQMTSLVTPPLEAMANGRLRETMPRECAEDRDDYCATVCHLEILGRSLAGIAPWLALDQAPENEASAQQRLQQWSRDAITHGLDPQIHPRSKQLAPLLGHGRDGTLSFHGCRGGRTH